MKVYLIKVRGVGKSSGSLISIKATTYREIYEQGRKIIGKNFLDNSSVFSIESGFLCWLSPWSIKDEALGVERFDPTVSWNEERDDVVYSVGDNEKERSCDTKMPY